jgi:hypothetical protein
VLFPKGEETVIPMRILEASYKPSNVANTSRGISRGCVDQRPGVSRVFESLAEFEFARIFVMEF